MRLVLAHLACGTLPEEIVHVLAERGRLAGTGVAQALRQRITVIAQGGGHLPRQDVGLVLKEGAGCGAEGGTDRGERLARGRRRPVLGIVRPGLTAPEGRGHLGMAQGEGSDEVRKVGRGGHRRPRGIRPKPLGEPSTRRLTHEESLASVLMRGRQSRSGGRTHTAQHMPQQGGITRHRHRHGVMHQNRGGRVVLLKPQLLRVQVHGVTVRGREERRETRVTRRVRDAVQRVQERRRHRLRLRTSIVLPT